MAWHDARVVQIADILSALAAIGKVHAAILGIEIVGGAYGLPGS